MSNNQRNQVSEMGIYLAIVFEFIGTLAFSALVGYALQRWVWPDQGAFVFLMAMMTGLAVAIYHIMRQAKHLDERKKKRVQPETERRISPEDSEKALEGLREMTERLEKLRRKRR